MNHAPPRGNHPERAAGGGGERLHLGPVRAPQPAGPVAAALEVAAIGAALVDPLHTPLQWPRSAPPLNPASTLPPAFLQFSRERGDEGRRIGEQAAAARRGR